MIRVSVFNGGRPEEVGAASITEYNDFLAALGYLVVTLMPEDAIVRESKGFRILIQINVPIEQPSQFMLFESSDDEEEMWMLLSVIDWYKVAVGQQ